MIPEAGYALAILLGIGSFLVIFVVAFFPRIIDAFSGIGEVFS